ncbi:hypothetical protein SAMN05444920_13215 [Nonomuraea solani]|uniref:Uncharacterized protein n=2 Tax=Nonomuraea solani TaxID=1144553 RepID=A0A1H6F1G1_9ACTN|nr:hypothetical protein SAMN05444920_13215 [Nonomuraea solani]
MLNMPDLDENATHNDDTPQNQQQAALYTTIADWAQLSARAAENLGLPEITERFAFLIEYTDQHAKGWHPAPSEHTEGITHAHTAETAARTVLARYITHLAEHRDDYQLWLVDSLSLRAYVWHVDTAEAHPRGLRRSSYPASAHTYREAEIPPHAVEIRTPLQIHRFMDHHITP